MSKKVFIGIIIVVMFVGVTILLSNKLKNRNIDNLVEEYCTTDHSLEVAGDALTEWNCQLCGKSAINSDTNVPKLCADCAKKTGRCYQCGKLKK